MTNRFSDAVRAASDSHRTDREDRTERDEPSETESWSEKTRRTKKSTSGPWWARPGAAVSLSIAGLFIALALGGAAYWWLSSPGAESGDYVEVFLTDIPADMSALELTIAGVYVGEDGHALHVDAPVFDLLQLQGPTQSLRVASGFVPEGNHSTVRIVFAQAIATIAGQQVALEIPETQLNVEHGRSGLDTTSSAILFDIDVDNSVVATDGGLAFRPYVASVYVHEYNEKPDRAPDGTADSAFTRSNQPSFEDDSEARPPARQSTSQPTAGSSPGGGGSGGGGSDGGESTGDGTDTGNATDGIAPDLGDATSDETDLVNDTGDLVEHELDIIIQYTAGQTTTIAGHLAGLSVQILHTFPGDDAAYVKAKTDQITNIASHPDVEYIELVKPVQWTLDTSKQAIRADGLADLVTGLTDANGDPIDGRGVGVAVIDTGIDATHADLPYNTGIHPDPTVMANYKIESVSFQLNLVPLANTDTTSGHGTHVAGIVAGQGTVDAGHTGVAPGAKLYGLGIGEATTTLWTNQGLAWVRENHDKVDPPIRVVTNSWMTSTSYDPNAYSSRLVRDLVSEGVVVVFAAGNNGGDGSSIRTSGEGQNPAEGVIMVGATNDGDAGDRDGAIRSSSSRGQTTAPASWPDVMAPGTNVMSAKAFVSSGGLGLLENYREMSGTSMAAPHVAGVAALMLQADPGLSPADVESIVESTAYKFGDGGGYSSTYSDVRYNGSHYAKGHGLVDARSAVEAALA